MKECRCGFPPLIGRERPSVGASEVGRGCGGPTVGPRVEPASPPTRRSTQRCAVAAMPPSAYGLRVEFLSSSSVRDDWAGLRPTTLSSTPGSSLDASSGLVGILDTPFLALMLTYFDFETKKNTCESSLAQKRSQRKDLAKP